MTMLALAAQPPPAPPTTTTEDPSGRSTAFRPVENQKSLQSGEKLLVEAYAAIWLILFFFILLSWRRQRTLDRRIAALEAAVSAGRAGPAAARGGPDA
jgi:CcmD family protein